MLCKPLVIRVFAPEGDFVRKYALIFRGRVGRQDRKIKIRLQFEICRYRLNLNRLLCVLWVSFCFLADRLISLSKAYQPVSRLHGGLDVGKSKEYVGRVITMI